MAFPPLPDFLETPWYDEFVAWAAAVESRVAAAEAVAATAVTATISEHGTTLYLNGKEL